MHRSVRRRSSRKGRPSFSSLEMGGIEDEEAVLRSSSSKSDKKKDEMAIIRISSTKMDEFVDEIRYFVGQSPYFTMR